MSSYINTSASAKNSCCHNFVSSALERSGRVFGPIFNHNGLTLDACAHIFQHTVFNSNGSSEPKAFGLIRQVSSGWCILADKNILSFGWNLLNQTQVPSLSVLMDKIHQNCTSPMTWGYSCNALWNRFSLLTQEFQNRSAPVLIDRPVLGALPCQYENMQAQLDTSLIKLWLIICDDLDFQGTEKPKNIQEIREWINDPSNEEQLRHVTQLNLSDQGFDVTPLEITEFENLKSPDL